jgi:hypothetical protein
MATYSLYGTDKGNETVYEYTRRRWNELVANGKASKFPGVTNDKDGAFAASRLIYVELTKNPGLVTDTLPPDATYLEAYINNPKNPLTWLTQKAGQAAQAVTHDVAVNLDKPAEFLQSAGNALPWYVKPGAIVGILAVSIILPPLFGKSLEGIIKGAKGRVKHTFRKGFR